MQALFHKNRRIADIFETQPNKNLTCGCINKQSYIDRMNRSNSTSLRFVFFCSYNCH